MGVKCDQVRGKGGWRYLDTGQVLIESACSVERTEEALDTLLPMLPGLQYFRFNPSMHIFSHPPVAGSRMDGMHVGVGV